MRGRPPQTPLTARRGGPLRGASARRGGPLRGAGALGRRIPAGSEGRQRINNLISVFLTSEPESHKSGITVGLAPLSEYHYHKSRLPSDCTVSVSLRVAGMREVEVTQEGIAVR